MILAPPGKAMRGFSDTGMRVFAESRDWQTLNPLFQHERGGVAESVGGKVYVMGGYWGPLGNVVGDVQIYTPGTGSWIPGTPMTRGCISCSVIRC